MVVTMHDENRDDVMLLRLDEIRTDGNTQSRDSLSEETVQEYAQAMADGAEFPPIVVFHDGSSYWLADGFHRVMAASSIESETIASLVKKGARRDAVLYSVGANAGHGLRRTNADKRLAVIMLLKDEEWAAWSDREIARRCAVHNSFVGKVRASLSLNDSEKPKTYTTKHGTQATMKTENIGNAGNPRNWKPRAERAAEIAALAAEGHRVSQISAKLGIGAYQVRKIANEENIDLPDTKLGKVHALDVSGLVERTVHGIEAYTDGLAIIRKSGVSSDPEHAQELAEALSRSIRTLTWLKNQLKEIANGHSH